MGKRRDLGAALTMGAVATTKLKEAQEGYQSRRVQYQSIAEEFNPESTDGRPWGQALKKPEGAPLNLG